jgi:hypothetical protein
MTMEKIYCKGCGRRLNNIPFIGEPMVEFEEGFYCQKCAKERAENKRSKI